MKVMIKLARNDILSGLPFGLICETRDGAGWETGHRRRMWLAEFTKGERKKASEIFNTARKWYLRTGVPDEVLMSAKTFSLWLRIGAFCAKL